MLNKKNDTFKFTWMEFSGSLGDLGLFIPLVVAMTVSCELNIGVVLIMAGLLNIATGWLFRQPIPVQPMKALAAVVITEGMLKDELIAAGLIIGVALIVVSFFIEKILAIVPKAVVRGIQLGVGVKLALKGISWIGALGIVGWDSILMAILIAAVLMLLMNGNQPVLLYIFLFGFFILYLNRPEIYTGITLNRPEFQLYIPSLWAFKHGLVKGVLPQFPLTLLNSVIAVCALSHDYFPKRGISPKKMALSVGLMNICTIPFGGIPMCHGAGGLAAQYKFGARTGGSVIMLGLLKVIVGLVFGGALFELLQSYPASILGVMLIFAGIQLSKAAKDVIGRKKELIIALLTAGFILGVNTFAGFIVGMVVSFGYSLQSKLKG